MHEEGNDCQFLRDMALRDDGDLKSSTIHKTSSEHAGSPWLKVLYILKIAVPFIALVICGMLLWNVLKKYSLEDIIRELRAANSRGIALALLCCFFNYYILTFYDSIGLELLGKTLKTSTVRFTAFLSYALSNTVGLYFVSGGAVRLRLYTLAGLSPGHIAQIIALNGIHFWMGLFLLAGITCIVDTEAVTETFNLGPSYSYLIALAFLLPILVYFYAIARRRTPIKLWNWEIPVPSLGVTFTGLLIAAADWLLVGAVLYCVLPPTGAFLFPAVLSGFLLAQTAGVLTHVPGGIGIFETFMVYYLDRFYSGPSIIGALILFRAIYYLLPFFVAVFLLLWVEFRRGFNGTRQL